MQKDNPIIDTILHALFQGKTITSITAGPPVIPRIITLEFADGAAQSFEIKIDSQDRFKQFWIDAADWKRRASTLDLKPI